MINDKVDKVNEKLFESLLKGGKVKHELRVQIHELQLSTYATRGMEGVI